MESKQTLVEIAYNFLFKKKKSSFNEIWTYVKKQCNIAKEDEEKVAGELYTGIILNTNFFLKNDKFWYPRSEVSLEEIKEQHMIRVENNKEEIDSTETFADDETTNLINESDDEEEDDLDTINIQPLEDSYDDE